MQRREWAADGATVRDFRLKLRRRRRGTILGSVFDGMFTYYRRLRVMVWIGLHGRTRPAWKVQSDFQDLALLLERYGVLGPQILAGRVRTCAAKRDRAHWKRLLRMLEGCEFGLLPHPMSKAFLYVN